MEQRGPEEIRKAVRTRYGEIAREGIAGEGCSPSGCCQQRQVLESLATRMGYGPDQVQDTPERIGFQDIRITPREESRNFIPEWLPGRQVEDFVLSATIEAQKPF